MNAMDQDGKKHDLLPIWINAYIDSTIARIWLPLEAYKLFKQAFGQIYDLEIQLCPVISTLHKKLLAQNPSITFTLGN